MNCKSWLSNWGLASLHLGMCLLESICQRAKICNNRVIIFQKILPHLDQKLWWWDININLSRRLLKTMKSYRSSYVRVSSEFKLYSNLNVKELLVRNRRNIWCLREVQIWSSNGLYRQILTTQLNHLSSWPKWLSIRLRTKWLWVRIPLVSLI